MDNINWQRTRDILLCIVCFGIIFWASWSLMSLFVDAIVVLLLSLAVAFLITPVVNFLQKRGMNRGLAALLTYVVVLAAIGGLVYELVISLVLQVYTFSTTISNFADSLPQTLKSTQTALVHTGIPATRITDTILQLQGQATSFATSIPTTIYTFGSNVVDIFIKIFLILVLSFYLTMDGKRIRERLMGIVPKRWLSNALLFEDALNRVVGNYIRGQLTLALIVGVATGMICLFTGLGDYALICGILAFLFETIPMVGPALAAISPILLSLLIGGPLMWQHTLIICICFVVLQMFESNILGPNIVGHAVGLHPVAAILSLLVFAQLFGVFGALIATPVVAAGWVVLASIYRSARGESADQIMAQKRTPWALKRPTGRVTRPKREASKDELRSRVHVDNRVDEQGQISARTRTADRVVNARRTIDLSAAARRSMEEQNRNMSSGVHREQGAEKEEHTEATEMAGTPGTPNHPLATDLIYTADKGDEHV